MAESPAAPAGVAASRQDVLLATKLHVSRPQPGFVPRPRLTAALDEGLARRLTLVCAPAGFGKTALLAHRELEILLLLAAGKSNQRIARELVVSLDTVKKHVSHLLGKLGAANRTEAVTRARDLGVIS